MGILCVDFNSHSNILYDDDDDGDWWDYYIIA